MIYIVARRCDQAVEVIVRGHRNEPVSLKAIGVQGDRVEVTGSNPRYSIRYPISLVYSYDARAFEKMRRAYEQSDSEGLMRLWRQLPRYSESKV